MSPVLSRPLPSPLSLSGLQGDAVVVVVVGVGSLQTLGATQSVPRARAPHLACDLDALPDAEVADDPGEQETQGQLPAQASQVLDARADAQNTSPAEEGWGGVTPPGEAEGAASLLLCHHQVS